MADVKAVTRIEAILNGEDITPVTREEAILSGADVEPLSREEYFVQKRLGEGGGGGDINLRKLTIEIDNIGTDPQLLDSIVSCWGVSYIEQNTIIALDDTPQWSVNVGENTYDLYYLQNAVYDPQAEVGLTVLSTTLATVKSMTNLKEGPELNVYIVSDITQDSRIVIEYND